jgi:hypothetical protein
MFDGIAKKLATKMGRGVKEASAPIRAEVRQVANNKVDLYSRILRLAVLVFLFIDGTRRVTDTGRSEMHPNQIIINNYIDGNDRKKVNDRNGH